MSKLELIVEYLHKLPISVRYFFYFLYAFATMTLFIVAVPFLIIGIISAYLYCYIADYFETMDIPK